MRGKSDQGQRTLRRAGRASALGWEIAIWVIGFFLLGFWLDRKLGSSPTWALIGFVFGCVGGAWTLYKFVRDEKEDAP